MGFCTNKHLSSGWGCDRLPGHTGQHSSASLEWTTEEGVDQAAPPDSRCEEKYKVSGLDVHDAVGELVVGCRSRGEAQWLCDKLNRDFHAAWNAGRASKRPNGFPKIITLCGSTRFTAEMLDEAWRLTLEGNIVIHWNILNGGGEAFAHGAEREGGDVKDRIDALYLHKVWLADEVRVINVGGYIGESTSREVAYACMWGKEVSWLEADNNDEAWQKVIEADKRIPSDRRTISNGEGR